MNLICNRKKHKNKLFTLLYYKCIFTKNKQKVERIQNVGLPAKNRRHVCANTCACSHSGGLIFTKSAANVGKKVIIESKVG